MAGEVPDPDGSLLTFEQIVSPDGTVSAPVASGDRGAKRWIVGAGFDDAGRAYFACGYGYASPYGSSAWMLDEQGERWNRPLAVPQVASLAADPGGGAYATGNDDTPLAGFAQAWLVRLTVAGEVSWSAPLGKLEVSANSGTPGVAVSPCGDVFVVGVAPLTPDATGPYAPWVGRWSSAGVQVWSHLMGAPGEQGDGVVARPQGGAFVLVYRPGTRATLALSRLDDGGEVLWTRELDASGADGMAVDASGGVWLALYGSSAAPGSVILHVDGGGAVLSTSTVPAKISLIALAAEGDGVIVGGNDDRGSSPRSFVAFQGAHGDLPLP